METPPNNTLTQSPSHFRILLWSDSNDISISIVKSSLANARMAAYPYLPQGANSTSNALI